jgi:hypothetical protein
MNASLITLPIPLFTLLKLTTIPTIALLQYILYGKSITSPLSRLSLILILTGVGLGTVDFSSPSPSGKTISASDIYTTNKGLVYGLLGILFTSQSQLSLQHSKTLTRAQGLQTVALMSPYAFLIAFLCALGVEDAPYMVSSFILEGLSSSSYSSSSSSFWSAWIFKESNHSVPWQALMASCLISISTNLFGFALIQSVSKQSKLHRL